MPNSPPPPRNRPPSPPPPRFRIHHNNSPSPPPSPSRINLMFCAPFCAPSPPLSTCSLPSLVAAFPGLALALQRAPWPPCSRRPWRCYLDPNPCLQRPFVQPPYNTSEVEDIHPSSSSCQLHQFFVWCGVEPRLGVEAINDMQSLKEACRSAFEGTKTAPSATQQQVSEMLCQMGCLWRTRFAAQSRGIPSTCSCTTAPWGWKARAAAARARGQSSLMVLITSLRAGRQRAML
jgi:hypothetical protein